MKGGGNVPVQVNATANLAGLTFILGGARSGKSAFAETLARQSRRPVLYVATAQALDDEMRERVRQHQQRRPADWRTLEAHLQVGQAVQAMARPDELVLLDCLTLLVSNVILAAGEDVSMQEAQPRVESEVNSLLAFAQAHPAPVIIVSNEVGLGGVPLYPLGRIYQDALGWANQRVAAAAAQVYWVVAGLPIEIKKLAHGAT